VGRSCAMFVALALGALLAHQVLAVEKPVKKTEVPKAVLEAISARHPKAEMTGFSREDENGKTVFEVQLREAGGRTEIVVTPDGKILTEEKTVSASELPAAVQHGLSNSTHSKARILKAEKVTEAEKPEAPTYEILVQDGKRKYELVFSSKGELTKEEAQSGGG
jgi:hypothetical protein